MPRIDDYIQARELSIKSLAEKDPDDIAHFAGAVIRKDDQGRRTLLIKFLNRKLVFSWPGLESSFEGSDKDFPIQQQILLLHYLEGSWSSRGAEITGEWVSFQDVPDGRFYMDAFIKRAKDPLLKTFGDNPERMIELALKKYGAFPLDYGDFSVIVEAFPLVPMALVLWEGDEEFPAEGNILFDKNIYKILSAEDIAWLAGMVVYPLIGMASK